MVNVILLTICIAVVCALSNAEQNLSSTDSNFDDVQAAVFSRKAYPNLGDIPVLNRKIFRGNRVAITEHPYVVSIRRLHAHYLVGAILSAHIVVTVAHPIYNVPVTELGVVAGETYCDRGAEYMTVLLVVTHEDFDPYTLSADIALLRLYEIIFLRITQKPIKLFGEFKDIELKTKRLGHNIQARVAQRAFVTGWGRCDWTGNELCLPRSSVYFPAEKQDPMLRAISFDHSHLDESAYCVGYEKHKIRLQSGKGMLCVGAAREVEPLAPCLAAPGAPLTVQAELAGLLSWGFGCGYTHDLPLIYTDMRYYVNWTKDNIHILESLDTDHVSELYIATKAYLMQDWLMLTSEQRPTHAGDPGKTLQPADVDRQLVEVTGNVTDVRDYIYGRLLREQKRELYRILKAESDEKQKITEISAGIHLESKPFLNDQYYSLTNVSDTLEYAAN